MSDLHALLIGIDAYATGQPLNGCVNDIDAIQTLLLDRLGASPGAIRRLAAPQDSGPLRPTIVPTLAPTRTQILSELAALTTRLRRGDRVLVWYSGHGTQLQVAARNGGCFAREALVTVDGKFVFDWELSAALQALAIHAHVCVVLDCCSAGGATRDGLTVRFHDAGSGVIAAQVEVPQLAGARGIAQEIGAATDAAFVVAACLDDERACETDSDRECHGVLTLALLDALADVPQCELASLRWAQIWHRVEAVVASESPGQHPWISSSPWRRVFGGAPELGDTGYACAWLPEAGVLRIHAGTRSGVTIGAEIAVYGPEPARFPSRGSAEDEQARVAVAEVIEASDCEARAKLVSQRSAVWPDGCRGRLVKAGEGARLIVSVPAEAGALAARIARSDLLAVVHDGPADVTLAPRPDGRWALADEVYGLGEPALPTCARDDLARVVRLAEHYARYSMPLRLARRSSTGMLDVLLLDCNGRPDGLPAAEAQDPLLPPRKASDDGIVVLQAGRAEDDAGDHFCLRIANQYTEPLFVTVLDCDSDGGVALLADRVHIAPEASATVWHPGGLGRPFRAALAADQRVGIDRFVCIASTERTARFDHLALHATFVTGEAPTRDLEAEEESAAFAACVVTARLAHVAAPVDAPPPRPRAELGRGLAIVIGIDAYSRGNELKNARADAEAVGARLSADHGFEVTAHLDATLAALRAVCEQLVDRARGYERIIVYFAGHGVAELDDRGVLQGRLAASDTRFSSPDSFLPMSELRGACEAAAAAPHDEAHAQYRMRKRHVLLLLDCCAAGALGTRQARSHRPQALFRERYDRLLDHGAVQFIGAADHQQLAGDEIRRTQARRAGAAHSPFATALLAALARADGDGRRHPVDRDHDGVFLASELHAYIGAELYRWTATLPPMLAQTPVYYTLQGHEGGELVFAASKRRLRLPRAEQLGANASPYRGARPYEDSERDERVFFGRDEALAVLDDHVTKHPLTVVTGASRTGKTSLVQAGLVRRRREAGWEIHRIAPGAVPPAALPAGGTPRLLLVDPLDALAQFSADEARAFIAGLEQLVSERPDDRVVATLRDGNEALLGEGALAGPEPRWRAWELPAMTHETLRAAIEGPAEVAVLFLEPSLVDRVIERVLGKPGALALASRTLEAMFQHQVPRGDRTLTLDDYNAVGGVNGAVVQRAEALYQALPGAQPMLTRIFVRLADVSGEEVEPRALRADEIGAPGGGDAELRSLLDRLDEELLIVRGAMITVAHEAVLTRWARVASLLLPKEQREPLRVHAELAESAIPSKVGGVRELWSAGRFSDVHERLEGRSLRVRERIADVLRPARLVGRIAARMPVALSRDEFDFLQASARKRRMRALARGVPLVLLGVVAIVGKLALDRAEHARIEQAKLDELNKVRAAAGLARQDPRAIGTAIDQALAAIRPGQEHAPMLIQALLEVADAPATIASQVHKAAGQVLALSANGNVMTAVTRTETALLVGPVIGEQATLVSPAPDYSPTVAISPRGTWVAYAASGALRLWRVADRRWDGEPIALPPGTPFRVAFSGDEARVAVGDDKPSIGVWSVATHERIAQIEGDGSAVLALDRTGAWLLANSALVEVASGRSTTVKSIADRRPTVAAFSPDGARLAIGGPDGVGIWQRIESHALLQSWSRDPRGNVTAVAFSEDGTRVAATTFDGDAVLWSSLERGFGAAATHYLVGAVRDIQNDGPVVPIVFGTDFIAAVAINGAEVQVWHVDPPLSLDLHHAGPVLSLAAPRSGTWLVTGSVDRTARTWDTRAGEQRLERGRVLPVTAVAAAESWFAAGSIDLTVAIFRRDGGEQVASIQQLSAIHAVEISPSGWIASASGDGTVVVTDHLGAVQAPPLEHAPKKPGDPYSPDDAQRAVTAVVWLGERVLASAGNNGLVKIWRLDPPSATKLERELRHGAPIRSLAGSPDGAFVLSTAADGTAMLWRVADGAQQALVGHRGPVVSGRFSSDGAQVVTASEDGFARIWDREGGRLIHTFGGGEPVRDAAFAPGRCAQLVTISDDGMLRIWDTATGRERSRITAHSGRPSGPLVFLDRGRVASGGVDGSVRVFPTCAASVIRALCDRRDRSSTHAPGKAGACPVTQEEEKACCQ